MSGLSLLPTTLIASIVSLVLTRPLTMVDTQRGRTDLPSTVDTGVEGMIMGRTESTGLSDDEYRSLAEFRHALRVFLRFSEEAARAEG